MQKPGEYARGRESEHLFADLLASAYALQQRHDLIRARLGLSKFSEIITEVISSQSLIRTQILHSDTVMYLVANRIQKLSGAAGAAIAFLDHEELDYRAGTGIAASLVDCKIETNQSVSFAAVRLGQLNEIDSRQDPELAERIRAKSVLSAPLYRNGRLVGCIQLFSRAGELGWQAKHVCELMSDVVNLFISRKEWSPSGDGNGQGPLAENGLEFGQIKRPPKLAASASRETNQPNHMMGNAQNQNESSFKMPSGLPLRPRTEIPKRSGNGSGSAPNRKVSQGQSDSLPSIEELLLQLHKGGGDPEDEQQGDVGGGSETAAIGGCSGASKSSEAANGRAKGNLWPASSGRESPNLGQKKSALTELAAAPAENHVSREIAGRRSSPDCTEVPLFSGSSGEQSSSQSKRKLLTRIRAYLNAIAYPLLVLFFVTIVNMIAGVRGWILQVATIIIVALTTLELRSRVSKL